MPENMQCKIKILEMAFYAGNVCAMLNFQKNMSYILQLHVYKKNWHA